MSAGKVDVMALLDAEIAFAVDEAKHFKIQATRAEQLRAARAAVAELIEVTTELAMWLPASPNRERLRAILSRIGATP